eukprot:8682257-Prorocentrum_lima.AAC.1
MSSSWNNSFVEHTTQLLPLVPPDTLVEDKKLYTDAVTRATLVAFVSKLSASGLMKKTGQLSSA